MATPAMTQPNAAGAAAYPQAAQAEPNSRKWWALIATCFGLFMTLLDVTVVNVALPTIQLKLNASFADLQWVISAYTIALAVFLVTAGRLGDIFGRKRVFMTGLGVFTLGSLICALSGTITIGTLSHTAVLLAGRAVQGLGGAVMVPLSLAIISTTFQGRQRGAAIGIWGGITGLATAIGPVVGGVLVQKVSWESIFYLNVPIGVVGIALSAWAIRESRDERAGGSIDFFGLAALTVSLFCLVLALIQGNDADKGWTSPYILALFAVAAVAMIVFILVELRLKNPMVDPRLFANRSFTGAAVAAFALSAGLYSMFFFLALYLQNFLGFSALDAGLRFLPLSVPVLFTAPLAGALTGRIGARPLLTGGLAVCCVAVLLMARISPQNHQVDWVILLPAFILAGLGSGAVNPPISTVAVGSVEPGRAGMASGVSGVCRQIGTAFGIAFLGAVLTSQYNSYVHNGVMALRAQGLPAVAKQTIITGVQKAGTIAGSLGLPSDPRHPSPYAGTPTYAQVQQIARASFVDGTTSILHIAAVILAIGALASLVLVRKPNAPRPGAENGGGSEGYVAAGH